MTYFWTTAPEAYDYSYTSTIETAVDKYGKTYRLVGNTDSYRFANFQMHRYGSGMHPCFEEDSEHAEYLGLKRSVIKNLTPAEALQAVKGWVIHPNDPDSYEGCHCGKEQWEVNTVKETVECKNCSGTVDLETLDNQYQNPG